MMRSLVAVPLIVLMVLIFPSPARADESVHVKLLELNRSGASGTAILTALPGGDLRVRIRSTGLVPNAPHAQHLHGSTSGMDFHCPDASADTDGDGYVSTEEGMPSYGDIFVSLTVRGDVSRESGLAVDRMPVADAGGAMSFDRTFKAADLPPGTVEHLKDLHVVQHGLDANSNGRYDLDALGESTMATGAGLRGIPQEATNPSLCGMVTGAAAGSVPVGGVATGDGSTLAPALPTWSVVAGFALVTALGAALFSRRRHLSIPRSQR